MHRSTKMPQPTTKVMKLTELRNFRKIGGRLEDFGNLGARAKNFRKRNASDGAASFSARVGSIVSGFPAIAASGSRDADRGFPDATGETDSVMLRMQSQGMPFAGFYKSLRTRYAFSRESPKVRL